MIDCIVWSFEHLTWIGGTMFLIGYVVHQLENNILLPLYRVLLFSFSLLGYNEWCCFNKVMLIYRSCFSLSFPQHVNRFASNSHLTYYLPLFFSFWIFLVPLSLICASLDFLDMGNIVFMWSAISLWIQFGYTLHPHELCFCLKKLICLTHISFPMLDKACNVGC